MSDNHHHVNYLLIFIALCVLTALSVVFDVVHIQAKSVLIVLVLAVAVAKAQFVMRYFMHLKFEGRWKYLLLLPTAILAVGVPMALFPDIGAHYYHQETPQTFELAGPSANRVADAHGEPHPEATDPAQPEH